MNKEKNSKKSADDEAFGGIGTYMEKSLHSALKYMLCSDETRHEHPLGRYVADVLDGEQIYEVQTGSFRPLKPKIKYYLESTDYSVCVVMPIYAKKWLSWIDPESGEMVGERKISPKKEKPSKLFTELLWLLEYVGDRRLSFRLVLLEVEEVKLLNGYGESKKRKAEKYDKLPISIIDEVAVSSLDDIRTLFPFDDGAEITHADIERALGLRKGRRSYITVKALTELGIITHIRTDKRTKIFKVGFDVE